MVYRIGKIYKDYYITKQKVASWLHFRAFCPIKNLSPCITAKGFARPSIFLDAKGMKISLFCKNHPEIHAYQARFFISYNQ